MSVSLRMGIKNAEFLTGIVPHAIYHYIWGLLVKLLISLERSYHLSFEGLTFILVQVRVPPAPKLSPLRGIERKSVSIFACPSPGQPPEGSSHDYPRLSQPSSSRYVSSHIRSIPPLLRPYPNTQRTIRVSSKLPAVACVVVPLR